MVRFFSVLFVALALAPALAHLLELPNKIHLSKAHYQLVQQSYRGWNRLAVIVIWSFTFPANKQTANWTTLPSDWEQLRVRWEYSHAASAVLTLLALVALIFSIVS
jgi:hypothetical protein